MPRIPPPSLGRESSDGVPKGLPEQAPHPFNPNTPLSRRSFVGSPKPPAQKPKEKPSKGPASFLVVPGETDSRPLGSPIPAVEYPEFADIRSPYWPTSIEFLRRFKASLLTYIPDGESHGALPVIHTYGVDGITPDTTAFPDPKRQNQGYGMYFSVNGFKSNKSRKEENLYCLNAFFADIDWPDKKNPPTNEQMRAFKQAIYEDLSYCIASGREGFVSGPRESAVCPPPTAIVETKNGFHVYWLLGQPRFVDGAGSDESADTLPLYREAQKAIVSRFQADPQCVDSTRVLRVPDSYHLKNPAEPFRIRLRYFEPENIYSFEQMTEFWLRNPNATNPHYAFHHAEEFKRKVETSRAQRLSSPKAEPSGPFKNTGLSAADGLSEDDLARLDAEFPIEERPSFKALANPHGIAEGSRNKSLLIAASLLRRAGHGEDVVLERFAGGYNGLPAYEIRNTIRSAYAGAKPYDFGWNDPVLSEHVTLEEAAKVKGIVKEMMEAKKSALKAAPDADPEEAPAPKALEPFDLTEQETLTLAEVKKIESEYAILDKATQKRLYNVYDRLFVRQHPEIVSVDDVGFFSYDAEQRFYSPLTEDGIRRIVSEDLLTLGCLDYRTPSSVSAKVESLEAFREIRMSRAESEAILFSDGRNGTILNTLSGFVDIDSGTLLPDSKRLFVTSVVPVRFDPSVPTTPEVLEALCPRFMLFLREITRSNIPGESEAKISLLQEMAGYCLTPYTFFQTAFLLLGSGANGKSTFLDVLKDLIGPNDTSTLSLGQLSSQFLLSGLYRKRMNIIEEIPNNYFESDNLKKIISGQEITGDRKYAVDPVRFKPTSKLVFAVNAFPRVNDQSHALYRRFKTIPFNVTFTDDMKDPDLSRKLWAERDGIFRWAVEGWQRLKLTGKFTHSVEAMQSGEDFKEHNSPLVEFILRDCILFDEARERQSKHMGPLMVEDFTVSCDALYAAYRVFAKENGYGVKSRQAFMKEMTTLTHSRLKNIGQANGLSSMFTGLRLRSAFIPMESKRHPF